MIAIKKDAMRYRDPETGKFVGVSLIGGDAPSGGTPVEMDDTLTQSGKAADAKAVGDSLTALNQAIGNVGNPTDEQVSTAVNAYLTEHPVSGLSDTASALLITILRGAVYASDQSANITALENALGNSGSGTPEEPIVTTYTISSELINCTSSNGATSVNENDPYTATLTANDGYTLVGATVSVTMGGADITNTAYADGVITIAAVTGNVEIIASALIVEAEAVLPEDGLLAYFDFRTVTYNNKGSGGTTTIAPTKGSGQLFTWANDSISEQNDYGLVSTNLRSWMYDQNGGTKASELGTSFTVVSMTYGELPLFGFNYSNGGARWTFSPKYIDSSGGTVNAESINGSNFNSDRKTDYNFTVVRAEGANLTEIMDTSRAEYDGGGIDAFVKWLDKVGGNVCLLTGTSSHVAMAIYNRALTDPEIEACRDFMKTLEVSA